MSVIEEALKKTESLPAGRQGPPDAPEAASAPAIRWGWIPNILLFIFLSVALWNYLSEKEYRRRLETRLETTISDLDRVRTDFERVERQSREMEDLLHAELEAANGRIAKMKFDLDALRRERDSADTALAAAQSRIETLSSQNRRLHQVIQSRRARSKSAPAGFVAWDPVLPDLQTGTGQSVAGTASET